jgi:hypothetical protein
VFFSQSMALRPTSDVDIGGVKTIHGTVAVPRNIETRDILASA